MADSIFDTLMKQKAPSEAGVLNTIQAVKQAPGLNSSKAQSGLVKQAGQEALQAGAQEAQKQQAIGAQNVAFAQADAQKADAARQIALQKLSDKNEQRLQSLNNEAVNQANANSRQFITDSAGRKYMNQQMLDQYASEQLVNSEALNSYVQQKEQTLQRKLALLDTYQKKMEQVLQQGYLREGQELDQQSRETIARLAAAFEKKKADEAKKLQKSGVMKQVITGAFTAAGAVAGGYFAANPAVGAAAGSAIGSMVGAGVSEATVN